MYINIFFNIDDIYLYSIFALASLVIIMISASYIISALSHYAKETGVSDYLIGFLVVSIGTSLPELTTAFMASFSGNNQIILGNVIGANIIDVTIVLGLTSIIGKKIKVHGKILDKTVFTVLFLSMIPLLFGIDGVITRLEGLLLIIAFFLYIFSLLKKEGHFGHIKKKIYWKDIWQDILIVSGCIIALLLSTEWLIISAQKISLILEIPTYFVGLILMAFGTTIPELTVNISSVLKGSTGIAFGDILGSVICNSSLVLGIGAIIKPIVFNSRTFIPDSLFMVSSVFIAIIYIKKKEITWEEGVSLLLLYITFLVSGGLIENIFNI
jgi:cation:H+ antiporter